MHSRKCSHWLASHDPFWPRIHLDALREQLELPAQVSDARLEVAALGAVRQIGQLFAHWRKELRALGYQRLDDVSTSGRQSRLTRSYLHAVRARTRQALHSSLHIVECRSGGAWR